MSAQPAEQDIPTVSTPALIEGVEAHVNQDFEPAIRAARAIPAFQALDDILVENFGEEGRDEIATYLAQHVPMTHFDAYMSTVFTVISGATREDSDIADGFFTDIADAGSVSAAKAVFDSYVGDFVQVRRAVTPLASAIEFPQAAFDRTPDTYPQGSSNPLLSVPAVPRTLGLPNIARFEGNQRVRGISDADIVRLAPAGRGRSDLLSGEADVASVPVVAGPQLQDNTPDSFEMAATFRGTGAALAIIWVLWVTSGCLVQRFWIPVNFAVLFSSGSGDPTKRTRFRVNVNETNITAFRIHPIAVNADQVEVRRL